MLFSYPICSLYEYFPRKRSWKTKAQAREDCSKASGKIAHKIYDQKSATRCSNGKNELKTVENVGFFSPLVNLYLALRALPCISNTVIDLSKDVFYQVLLSTVCS